jgi:hypothetical protein
MTTASNRGISHRWWTGKHLPRYYPSMSGVAEENQENQLTEYCVSWQWFDPGTRRTRNSYRLGISLCFSRESNTGTSARFLVTKATELQKAWFLKCGSFSGSKFKQIKCHDLRHLTVKIPSIIYTVGLWSMQTVINVNPSFNSCEKAPLSRHLLESNVTPRTLFHLLSKQFEVSSHCSQELTALTWGYVSQRFHNEIQSFKLSYINTNWITRSSPGICPLLLSVQYTV